MDDRNPHDDESSVTSRGSACVSVSRRRFTRAGLSGTVVLGSLTSKPVLGAAGYHCTVSGQVSGNLSRASVTGECVQGLPASDWLAVTTWPTYTKGALPSQNCVFTSATGARPRGTPFNGTSPGVGVPVLINAFANQAIGSGPSQACSVIIQTTETSNPSTMLQVLSTTNGGDQYLLGRVVVTSLLNAANRGSLYPVTPHTIVAMFNATFGGGNYFPVAGTTSIFWDRTRVIQYLSSLFTVAPP
jgi:hypothetical protein